MGGADPNTVMCSMCVTSLSSGVVVVGENGGGGNFSGNEGCGRGEKGVIK